VKTAKLPAGLLAEKPRRVSELAIGETAHVGLFALIVTPEQDCFLDAKGSLEKPGLMQMTVRRDEEGFHVVLPSTPEHAPQPLLKGIDVLPIASIEISTNRWTPGMDGRLVNRGS
jgi:hypothetical protein